MKKIGILTLLAVIVMIGLAVCVINMEKYINIFMIVALIILVIIFVLMIVEYHKINKKKRQEKEAVAQRAEEEKRLAARKKLENDFVQTCKKNNITELTESNRDSFILIARNFNLDESSALKILADSKEAELREKQAQEAEKLKKEIERVNKYYADMEQQSSVRGKEKYLVFAKTELDRHNSYLGISTAGEKFATVNARSIRNERPSDWAVHGGLASAIAGPAAGVAVAADIQQRNANAAATRGARLQRQENLKSELSEAVKNLNSVVNDWNNQINLINQSVLDDSQKIFDSLSIEVLKAECMQSGNMELEIKVYNSDDVTVLDKPAFVDGSFAVYICENGRRIGKTLVCGNPVHAVNERYCEYEYMESDGIGYYCMDIDTIGFHEKRLSMIDCRHNKRFKGMQTYCVYVKPFPGEKFEFGKQYTFEFENNYMWAIQKWDTGSTYHCDMSYKMVGLRMLSASIG